jgi:hypothetical protein
LKGTDKREYYLGEAAIAKRGVLTLSYPAWALQTQHTTPNFCVQVHLACLGHMFDGFIVFKFLFALLQMR